MPSTDKRMPIRNDSPLQGDSHQHGAVRGKAGNLSLAARPRDASVTTRDEKFDDAARTPPNRSSADKTRADGGSADIDRIVTLLGEVLVSIKNNVESSFPGPSAPVVEGSSEVQITKISDSKDSKPGEGRPRASKVEYKSVNEVWDKKTSTYSIAQPVALTTADELDQYLFIHRKRIDRKTQDPTSYVDIKSNQLQEILVKVLRDVRGICIREDKPTIEANLLYSFHREIKLCLSSMNEDPECSTRASHLQILVDFIENTYEATHNRLQSLLQKRYITYDLLWALFKPNADIYTTCPGTEKPMCVRCNHGEEKTRANGSQYFCVEARQFDHDGKVFGEATVKIAIEKFRGTKRIDLLNAFPLQYHCNSTDIRRSLLECGRKFVSLVGGHHHRRYEGQTFWRDEKGNIQHWFVNGRIIVDAVSFRRINPNYDRPQVEQSWWSGLWESSGSDGDKEDVQKSEVPPEELEEDDLLVCSPTVLGFSLNDKKWLEFAITDLGEIEWDPSSFDHLTIPPKQKKVVQALSESHLINEFGEHFDDFVQGKGKGLVLLLHGPPGVGKTLTAETMSERLRRPLYTISAGELGESVDILEKRLTEIFHLASHWKAALLLDEADVFVEERARNDQRRNALVCAFLRKLEYYEGILFLTTNRVETMDAAIASRIHLAVPYRNLEQSARMRVWRCFLSKAMTAKGAAALPEEDIERLARKVLNGREIKNAVSTARALAAYEKSRVRLSHLEEAIDFNKQFQSDFRGAGQVENMHSYM